MVLKRAPTTTALVVPDEETWLVWGGGHEDEDVEPTVEPTRAEALIVPERVPEALAAAVRSARALLPRDVPVRTFGSPLPGVQVQEALEPPDADDHSEEHHEHGGHEEHDSHGNHGEHDHGSMMEITGEPSSDGLVMESLDVQAGPLGVALPGGLVIRAELDGDVVADCEIRQELQAPEEGAPPDVWSAVAWSTAELAARELTAGVAPAAEAAWLRVAAVEVERAVSHVAWLHQLLRLLGWQAMTLRVRPILAALIHVRGNFPIGLATPDLPDVSATEMEARLREAAARADRLATELADSRLLRRRTAGLGKLAADDAEERGLTGPIARAAGVADDVRSRDRGYSALGFTPVVDGAGDAHARTLVRAREIAQSSTLAASAIARARQPEGDSLPTFSDGPAGVAETARGPIRVTVGASGAVQRAAPGARAAREAAAALAVGREWAAALVTVASFDLSPWRVGA